MNKDIIKLRDALQDCVDQLQRYLDRSKKMNIQTVDDCIAEYSIHNYTQLYKKYEDKKDNE